MPSVATNPAASRHKAKAQLFLDQYYAIPPFCVEMRLVALFYCALHLVEMTHSAVDNSGFLTHKDRSINLRERHRDAFLNYQPLESVSKDARYKSTFRSVRPEDVEPQYRERYLRWMEDWAVKRCGPEARLTASARREIAKAPIEPSPSAARTETGPPR